MTTPEQGENGGTEGAAETYRELKRAEKTAGMLDVKAREVITERLIAARAAISEEEAGRIDKEFAAS